MSFTWISTSRYVSCFSSKPLNLLIVPHTQSSKSRGGFGQERYEKEEMQKRVRKNFQAMKTKSWSILDAKQSIEKLSEEIHEIAKRTIEEASNKPLGKLWKY